MREVKEGTILEGLVGEYDEETYSKELFKDLRNEIIYMTRTQVCDRSMQLPNFCLKLSMN